MYDKGGKAAKAYEEFAKEMVRRKEINLNLSAVVEDLFTTQEQRQELELEKDVMLSQNAICDFPNHPFQVRKDEEKLQLIECQGARYISFSLCLL